DSQRTVADAATLREHPVNRKTTRSAAAARSQRPGSGLLFFLLDRLAGFLPPGEADFEVRHAREAHVLQHVGGERRALTARAVHDDPLRRIDLARVVVRRRIEPELQ